VYGSLGIAPLFLTWVYVSWYVVLSGARLAYAVEHADFHDEFRDLLTHPRSQELIATRIATLVTRAVLAGRPPPTPLALAQSLKLPSQRVGDTIATLTAAGLLKLEQGGLLPARDAGELTVADLSNAVGGSARSLHREHLSRTGLFEEAARVFITVDEASVEKLKRITWVDLATEGRGAAKG